MSTPRHVFEITDGIQTEQHGPEEAGYDNIGFIAYGKPCPWIRCLCGWESANVNHSWQDAGEDFDRHIEETK